MFLLLTLGAINALGSLLAIEFAFDEVLSESFGFVFSFQIDLIPHFVVFFAYIVSMLLLFIFLRFHLKKIDYSKREVV